MTKELISDYCKKIRIKSGLSANAFAKERGTSHTYIQDVENGDKDTPSVAMLVKLIRIYNLTQTDLENLDIDPFFKDDGELLTSLLFPGKFKHEINFRKQLFNIINYSNELKGYSFESLPDFLIKSDKQLNLTYDKKKKRIKYIYDVRGKTPDGNDCFLIVYNSSQRKIYDEDYILYISQLTKMVEGSIEFGMPFDDNISDNIELIFATSSHRGYELGKKIGIDNSYLSNENKPKILRRLIYFDNRKGKKNIELL